MAPRARAPRSVNLISRRVLIVFMGVMLLVTGELLWWIFFHVRSSNEVQRDRIVQLEEQRAWAQQMIALAARAYGVSEQLPVSLLREQFPDLEWQRGNADNPALAALYPGHAVFIRDDRIREMSQLHDAHIRMFLAEGGFFLLMVAVGGILIVRTLRHEVNLMRQQANFLSAVTHELKSPLASIRLYTETMQLRDPPSETRARYLQAMRSDVERLENLVGNLLAVARLEAGQFIVHPEAVDLAREVRTLVSTMQREMRPVAIELTAPEDPVMVMIDAAALHTVVRNLVDNAIKYGGEAPVQVSVAVRHDAAELTVRDTGIGVASAELAKIFQKFYRVGDEMVRQTEGSGLGLYLVNALVRQHHGDVSAQSAGPGQGTAFVVRFPLHGSEKGVASR